MKPSNLLLGVLAAALLPAAAFAAPPMAVKKALSHNSLLVKKSPSFAPESYRALLKAPAARFVNVSAAETEPNLPEIIGGMLDSGSWGSTMGPYGLYRLPRHEGEAFEFVRSGIFPNGGGVEADGTYFSTEVEEGGDGVSIIVRAYDTATWRNTRSFSPGDYSFIATDLAHDPVSGQIYGCLWDTSGSGYMFGTIDFLAGYTTKIKSLDNMWNAIAIDRDGTIYAIDQEMRETGNTVECVKASLYRVDRSTGNMTLIGDTGLLPYYASSAVIDHKTGRLFWSVVPKDDSQAALYEVDKATGACTLIYRYPSAEQFMGFYIPAPLADDAAPAAVQNLAAQFTAGSLEGTVSFDVPTTTYGGKEGSGNINYDIFANGTRVASGATAWGKHELVPIALPMGGEVEFTVTLTNAAGSSPKEKVKLFAGTDVPTAPEVKASWADGIMTVTWTKPTTSVNGGYIDPENLTYRVTRYPDGAVVASATTATTFTESVPVPTGVISYYYTVQAVYDYKASAAGTSNRVVLGASLPPYKIDFSTVDNFDDVTVVNVEPDSKGFILSGGAALLREDQLMEKDDWIITAPVRLVPGSVYAVKVAASSQGSLYPENIEVKVGETNTVEAMTETVIPRVEVSTASASTYKTFTGYISVQSERTVFVGVHACSPAYVYNLRVASITVEAAFDSSAPGASTAFAAVPDANGARSVALSLTAPETDYDGKPLAAMSKLNLYRDGAVIHTVEAPVPGQQINYTDNASTLTAGEHTYAAIAFDAAGNPGREVNTTVYVGIGKPAAPTDVQMTETETDGQVHISWSPVATNEKGYAIAPSLVTYNVYKPNATGESWQLVENVSATETTITAAEAGTQAFALFAVAAVTADGTSSAVATPYIAVGKPFALPFNETFAGGTISTLFTYTGTSGDWEVAVNDPQYLAQADDGGFAQMVGEYYGSSAALISGKIDLTGAQNPVLNFSTFNYYTAETGPDYNQIEVQVSVAGGEWLTKGQFIVNNCAEANRWGAVAVNLAEYKGKTVQLMFLATNYSYDRTTLDQIRVANGVDHNLSLMAIDAPQSAAANEPFAVKVKVENTGLLDATDFTVVLSRNGVEAGTRELASLRAGRSVDVAFEQTFSPLVEEDVEYSARLVYTPDMVASDNTSATVAVKPILSPLPVITTLTGTLENGKAVLSWDEPDTENVAPDPITESFESAEPYAVTGQCGWIFVDADGAPTQSSDIVLSTSPSYPNAPGIGDCSPLAWGVLDFNSGFASHYSMFQGHTGAKSLVALASDGVQNDDWAISPELYGGSQTVTFWAKSGTDLAEWGTEHFELLYSTTGTAITDFVKISEQTVCSTEWVKFTFNLPAGAKHFAVRYISNDTYSMMLDDFTFIPAGAAADLSLLGYHVYRNEGRITSDPHEDNVYTDHAAYAGNHSYVVTVLYDKGESRASNAVTLQTTGIGETIAANLAVRAEGNVIVVEGAEGRHVSVAAVDGKLLASAVASAWFEHTVATAGVYIVSVEGASFKIVAK